MKLLKSRSSLPSYWREMLVVASATVVLSLVSSDNREVFLVAALYLFNGLAAQYWLAVPSWFTEGSDRGLPRFLTLAIALLAFAMAHALAAIVDTRVEEIWRYVVITLSLLLIGQVVGYLLLTGVREKRRNEH